jgi:hypothetical protein
VADRAPDCNLHSTTPMTVPERNATPEWLYQECSENQERDHDRGETEITTRHQWVHPKHTDDQEWRKQGAQPEIGGPHSELAEEHRW